MDSPDFILIPCRSCFTTTILLGNRHRPLHCARCRAPYDAGSAHFERPTDEPLEPSLPELDPPRDPDVVPPPAP
jgi:hypothetical protein